MYITQLRARGFNTVTAMVQLQRKVAFPFATVIMTLLAVPFAAATGRRGAMYGIGFGIALSIAYWVILNVFSAVGEGGVMTPMLAAWAPNLLFGAVALYMILTVRTDSDVWPASRPRSRTYSWSTHAGAAIHTRPEAPGFVFVESTTKSSVRTSASGARYVSVSPTGVNSSRKIVCGWLNVST